jgi:glycosyltransferase involved in cell wall biosynthesis
MGPPGVAGFFIHVLRELAWNLPAMLRMRRHRRRFHVTPSADPGVACVSDNLDEVNGIALASRIQLRELRRLGHRAYLFGVAFRTRPPRNEPPDDALRLAPGVYSIDQAGYPHSELVVPRLANFLEFLDAHPVDLIEFETPGPVSVLCLIAAKIVGIPTLSHYRTDLMTYSELLLKNRLGIAIVQASTRVFTRAAGPVVVPSEAYRRKVAAMGVKPERIAKLPRGVDLTAFNPAHRAGAGFWESLGVPEDGFKLLYVGRVSMEKNLPALCPAFEEALRARPDLRLIVVGDGPYLEAMKARLASCDRAHFTGVLRGETLSRAFASADLFVFPSLTDTFGNSVIEALASGLPCLVSDEGGPSEIVLPGECGEIFPSGTPNALRDGILDLAGDPARMERYRPAARRRASEFTYEAAAQSFWSFYLSRIRGD